MLKWWISHKKKNQRILDLENQIELMKQHIQAQKEENLSLKKQIRELEMLWDIETTKRY
jgi:cell division protein FtsL